MNAPDSTGRGFKNLVMKVLQEYQIPFTACIGRSIDGAPNMRGQYKGFQRLLALENPNLVHVWCYAHVLNLVMAESTNASIACIPLFGL